MAGGRSGGQEEAEQRPGTGIPQGGGGAGREGRWSPAASHLDTPTQVGPIVDAAVVVIQLYSATYRRGRLWRHETKTLLLFSSAPPSHKL